MPTTATVRRYTSGCKRLLTGIAIAAAGCSDPSAARLEPGSAAVLVDPSSDVVRVQKEDGSELLVGQGAAAVVVSDSQNAEISDSPSRGVRVTIKDGEAAGASVVARRVLLKPR